MTLTLEAQEWEQRKEAQLQVAITNDLFWLIKAEFRNALTRAHVNEPEEFKQWTREGERHADGGYE